MAKSLGLLHVLILAAVLRTVSASDFDSIAENIDMVADQYRHMSKAQTLEALDVQAVKMDQEFSQYMTRVLARNHSINELSAAMFGRVSMREFPLVVTLQDRQRECSAPEHEKWVSYRRMTIDDKTDIFVLEPSLGAPAQQRLRFSTSLSVVVASGSSANHYYIDGPSASRVNELPVTFLGFVERGAGMMPDIALLSGPAGSGSFASVELCRWDQQKKMWQKTQLAEMSGLSAFSYNPEACELKYSYVNDGVFAEGKLGLQEESKRLVP